MSFRDLHHQSLPLLLCNVWDAASARVAEKSGYKAIGTSSAAIASMLGYADGENISFAELRYIIERILSVTTLPLTVDIESGYSREPKIIAKNIDILTGLGVVGVNIEDSTKNAKRALRDANAFAEELHTVKSLLVNDVFLNVRTDPFLVASENALEETIKRGALYQQAGADGLFVPFIFRENDIESVVKSTDLPVNILCMPKLPSFPRLQELGIKRISMGNALFDTLYRHMETICSTTRQDQSCKSIFNMWL